MEYLTVTQIRQGIFILDHGLLIIIIKKLSQGLKFESKYTWSQATTPSPFHWWRPCVMAESFKFSSNYRPQENNSSIISNANI